MEQRVSIAFHVRESSGILKIVDVPALLHESVIAGNSSNATRFNGFGYYPMISPDIVYAYVAVATHDPVTHVPAWPPSRQLYDFLNADFSDWYGLWSWMHWVLAIFGSSEDDAVPLADMHDSLRNALTVSEGQLVLGRSGHELTGRHVEMELYVSLDEAVAALSIARNLWDHPDLSFMWTYPMTARVVLQDTRPGIVGSFFADRDTFTMSSSTTARPWTPPSTPSAAAC